MTIRNKLIIYTFASILLTLMMVGFSTDRILTNLYGNKARAELNHSYEHFQHQLATIQNDILVQGLQISTDSSVIALTNLVGRYQDSKNYEPLIFDNDKKKAATKLLNQIALTRSNYAMLYGKDGGLIAYAIKKGQLKIAGITSYKKGMPVYFNNIDQGDSWVAGALPKNISPKLNPLNSQASFLAYSGRIDYFAQENNFVVENSRIVSRSFPGGKVELLGVVRISKLLDGEFFEHVTDKIDTQISLLLKNDQVLNNRKQLLPIEGVKSAALLHGDTYSATEPLLENKIYYAQSYVWPTISGNNYLLVSLPKLDLIAALNSTRTNLLIIFSVVAILVILFSLYWLSRLISEPLNALVEQAQLSGSDRYPQFPVSKANDEISLLGETLNNMVATIRNRETDLTNRTQRLNNAQRLAKVGDWEFDHATNTMQWSDEAYNIFDLNPKECKPSREIIFSIIHPDDVDAAQKAFEEALANKHPFDIVRRIMTKDKHTKYIHMYGETFYENGKPSRSVGTMQDITDQTNKDKQLRRTQKMDALGKLTGGIAHDFNNMLGVILGFAELLQMSSLGEDKKTSKYITAIIRAGERASKLTKKLLTFSRKDTSAAAKTDINQLLHNAQHMLEKILTVRIQLKFDLASDLWPVWLDKDELDDAIVNMSINAMHAMPADGELTFSTRNISLNEVDANHMTIPVGDYVLLSITDTGIGMDNETLQHIFEPFFTTKDDKGTGLGMSQVYGFVQRSKGAIYVYSEPGHGTRITIYFPRYQGSLAASVQSDKTEDIDNLTGTATILVVDDEPALRVLAQEILTSHGYKVLTADSANQALEVLERESVDLMLSDVVMPGMNGYQLAAKVRENYPQIKIQMASGFSDVLGADIEESDLHQNRLQKPFSSELLLQCVKKLLLET